MMVHQDAAPPVPVCPSPSAFSISEGGRAVLPYASLESDDLEITGDGERVLVYAPYGATSGRVRAWCDDVPSEWTAIEVRPLAWTREAQWDDAQSGPPGREYGAFWIDGDALWVFGGFHYEPKQFTPGADLWRFDLAGRAWTEMEAHDAPMLPGGRTAVGPTPGTILYFGGSRMEEDGSLATPPTLRTLDMASQRFSSAPHEMEAPGSYTGAFVRDAKRDRWLSICGADGAIGVHCDVHAYSSAGWERVRVARGPKPAPRYGFHYAYDEETDRVFVVAGQTGPANLDMIGDAWALELGEDPPRWVMIADETDGVRRRNGAFVLDPIGRRLLMFGGTADGRVSVPDLWALGLDRGRETWTAIPIAEEVPMRTSGIGVYDAERDRALFGFGNGDAVYTDLWALAL